MRATRYISAILCAVTLGAATQTVSAESQPVAKPDFVLAIDAGHGGDDKGCNSGTNYEKNITLDVAKRFQTLVEKACGDSVKVVMTRKTDVFVPLGDRARIANEAQADLFVSIHVNSIDKRSKGRHLVHGASVYTVGLHKSEANLKVAMRENAVIELEEDFSETYQGFDPNSSESYIIFELGQNRNMHQSIAFADMAQQELINTAGRADKGVRQAGFLVLWATKMPAVLVELDFICNTEAARFLASEKGRQKCAQALFNAFKTYRMNKSI
ncbi:MAG: N-acetylmuramoyl-L-alanine amidase [Muribaculaceae bacterium]|nr:N-acetylmuramoyl-L-alanine amidase [Muribaculaceae bacterium]